MTNTTTFAVLTIIFFTYIIAISIKMLLENRPPYSFLAWLTVLIFMPFLGAVLYFFLGVNWKKSKKKISAALPEDTIKRHFSFLLQKQKYMIESINTEENKKKYTKLASLALTSGYAPIMDRNEVEVFSDGAELFDKLIRDIEMAQESIHMEYFIWRSDILGERIKEVLIRKSSQGVNVRLIFDGAGCLLAISRKYRRELKKAGIKFFYFHDPFSLLWTRFVNYRNHRKIVVIDGAVAYTGGMNIGQEYIDGGKRFESWKDTHMRFIGDTANFLQSVFVCDWYNAGGRDLTYYVTSDDLLLGKDILFPIAPEYKIKQTLPIQIVTSGPDSKWDTIHKVYTKMITLAEREVCIQSPYFVPDEGLKHAIENAALSGTKINIMITGVPDKKIAWWVAQTYFETLLEAGVNIYLYTKGFLHSKVVIIDDEIVSSGTCNMDIRSFSLHYEINAILYDMKSAKKFKEIFNEDIKNSHKVTIEEYRKQPILKKLRNSICRIIAPAL